MATGIIPPVPPRIRTTAILVIAGMCFGAAAGEVSFFVPEDHEKFPVIDSLYRLMTSLESAAMKFEPKLIADKEVRDDTYDVKAQYSEYLLEHHLRDTTAVIEYCCAARVYLQVAMAYFQEMMSTQEGNSKASCFSLFRKSRTQYAAMNDVVMRYREYVPADDSQEASEGK